MLPRSSGDPKAREERAIAGDPLSKDSKVPFIIDPLPFIFIIFTAMISVSGC